jgi:RimJ/RimL family protein N-acetyltransferase
VAALPDDLFGDRLHLRRWSLGAIDEVAAAIEASFTELHTWMRWAATMPTHESLTALVREDIALFDADEHWSYWIRERDGGALVGGAGLNRRGVDDELEIGYWVRTDRTGRGYATEAARILTDAAFDADLGIASVKISMDRAHAASAAVPPKLGFRRDAEYERDIETPGHSGSGIAWVIDRHEWLNQPS